MFSDNESNEFNECRFQIFDRVMTKGTTAGGEGWRRKDAEEQMVRSTCVRGRDET